MNVLRWTGLRIRDVRLKRSRVKNGNIVLHPSMDQKPVKLIFNPGGVKAREDIANGNEYFVLSGFGRPKSTRRPLATKASRLGEIADVHIHAYRWRHTFASDLLPKEVPVSEIAAILRARDN